MKNNRILFSMLAIWGLIMSCNMPFGMAPAVPDSSGSIGEASTETPSPVPPSSAGEAAVASPTFTAIAENTLTPTPTETPCSPNVIAPTPVNIRSGPGTVYEAIDGLGTGQSAKIAGKSADGTWWYIEFPASSGRYGWVGGTVVTASCVPASLVVIPAPPTPLPPVGTCKDGYVHRLIRPGDKTCVTPASKAQADADNAAAYSRTIVGNYGASACTQGYVWREAFPGDVVCVTPATRSQAQADNAAAATRVDPLGAYGPNTCVAGYVWREAYAGDVVCVTPAVRSQTASDNAAAASRVAGPYECISGFVWREAFGSDKVCVTPAVKNQVAIDNAAAPSHTW